jgi:hypothetical protein
MFLWKYMSKPVQTRTKNAMTDSINNNKQPPKPTYLAERGMEGKNQGYYLATADSAFGDAH